ncbi:MAG: GspE/PulE family protein, partial [bacterium]|nr:GspE/PulE family protein [bacterium]
SHLDISEKRIPQDGRLKVKQEHSEIDFRVSTIPGLLGEKCVMRILSRSDAYRLKELGIEGNSLEQIKSALDEPYGMVLVTGPTGHGKTTTLFAMLEYLDSPEVNIITIENPIEYRIPSITQIQTSDKVGLSFSAGLRSALRQDPDIIMVGEIRDEETAEIAARASMTGHKVLSTLHTNNAASSIIRLTNLGVPPFIINSTVNLVVAQKLLHVNCPHCKQEYLPGSDLLLRTGLSPDETEGNKFFHGVGCVECNYSGFLGRTGIFEVMLITDEIREVIQADGTEMDIKRMARENGMKTLRDLALDRALQGMTTLEEVIYQTPSDPVYAPRFRAGIAIPPAATGEAAQVVYLYGGRDAPLPGEDREESYDTSREGKLTKQDILAVYDDVAGEKLAGFPAGMLSSEHKTYIAQVLTRHLVDRLRVSLDIVPKKINAGTLQENHLGDLLETWNNDLFSLFDNAYPGTFHRWEFKRKDLWNKKSGETLARQAVTWLIKEKLGVKDLSAVPQTLVRKHFTDNYLGDLLGHYHCSPFAVVNLAFPNRFKIWQFTEEAKELWKSAEAKKMAGEACRWLVEEKLTISVEQIPHTLSNTTFYEHGLKSMMDLFDHSIYQVVENAYPNRFKRWEFKGALDLWHGSQGLDLAHQATRWLVKEKLGVVMGDIPARVSRKDFVDNGLGAMLAICFKHSHIKALKNAYPDLVNPERFDRLIELQDREYQDLYNRWKEVCRISASIFIKDFKTDLILPNFKKADIVSDDETYQYSQDSKVNFAQMIISIATNCYDPIPEIGQLILYCKRLVFWILNRDEDSAFYEVKHPKVGYLYSSELVKRLEEHDQGDIAKRCRKLMAEVERIQGKIMNDYLAALKMEKPVGIIAKQRKQERVHGARRNSRNICSKELSAKRVKCPAVAIAVP